MSKGLGTVAEIWVFPVKSMLGGRVERALVGPHGVDGDRSWAVAGPDGALVTAADEPRLREVAPIWGAAGLAALRLPDGTEVAPEEAGATLSSWLGREVHLVRANGDGGFVDVAPVHVVSRGGLAQAASPEHASTCTACDVREPRANLVLDLAADGDADGDAERALVGATVRVGATELRVVRHPDHCLGVYAEVVTPGELAVGDEVLLSVPAEP